ncbi:MAG: PH domain-containing protein [Chromatocurvus sp.]
MQVQYEELLVKELYAEHPAMFKNNPLGFILSVLLIAVGVGIIILLWWYLQTKASKLTVFENEVMFEKGLLSKERSEVNIGIVRTVRVKQSFFNRIFGVGTVEIFTAGDNPEIVARGMPDPNRIRELIKMGQKD